MVILTKRLLDSRETAKYMSISRAKLYELEIPSVTIGRRRLWDVDDVDDWIERLKKEQNGHDRNGYDNHRGYGK
ncbi:MAG: helix-turn-helix domain-containing protein [bacterium]